MNITNVKALLVKGLVAGFLLGAVVMAAPVKAEAQGFRIGVRVGVPVRGPVYSRYPRYQVGPVYDPYQPIYDPYQPLYGAGFYDRGWDQREVIVRHDEWRRDHDFHREFHGR